MRVTTVTTLSLATLVLSGGMLLAQQTPPQPVTPDQSPTNNTVTTDPTRNATTNPAQNPGVQNQTANPAQPSAATPVQQGQTRLEGCVTGPVSGSYILVANGKQYRLVGDFSNLREHVGQKVAITGSTSMEPSNPATAESGPSSANMPSSSNTTGATGSSTTTGPAEQANPNNVPSLNVSKVEMLAEHCDTATGGPSTSSSNIESGTPGGAGEMPSSPGSAAASQTPTSPAGVTTQAGTSTVAPQTQVPPATATKGESSSTPVTEAQGNTIPSSNAGTAEGNQNSEQAHSITGCLRKSPSATADTYLLRNASGNSIEIVPSDRTRKELADHVDQQVRLTGDWSNAAETAQAMPQSDQPSSQTSAAGQANRMNGQFKVDRIDVISTSCSETSKEKEY